MTSLDVNIDMTSSMPLAISAVAISDHSDKVSQVTKCLADIAIGEQCVVRQLLASAQSPDWAQQLEDIGFIVGEPVSLMARGAFGGDPLVIRVGLSTFALRKAEAACVLVDVVDMVGTARLKVAA